MNIGLLLEQFVLRVVLVLGLALSLASQATAEVPWFKTCSYETYSAKQYLPGDEFKTEEQIAALPQDLQIEVRNGTGENTNTEFLSYKDNQTKSFIALMKEGGSDLHLSGPNEQPDIVLRFFVSGEMSRVLGGQKTGLWMPAELSTVPQPNDRVRFLDSPWVRIKQRFEDGKCKLDVLYIWNWRQFVTDQANLHGVKPTSKKATQAADIWPLEYMTKFESLVVNLSGYTWSMYFNNFGRSPGLTEAEKQSLIIAQVSGEFPNDLLWYFKQFPLDPSYYEPQSKTSSGEVSDQRTVAFSDLVIRSLWYMSKYYAEQLPITSNAVTKQFLSGGEPLTSINSISDLGPILGPDGDAIAQQSKLRMPDGYK
jgi:hypothetical protein